MDGALKPNTILQDAKVASEITSPDNLVMDDRTIYFTSGCRLMQLDEDNTPQTITEFATDITAMAGNGVGCLAIALNSGELLFWVNGAIEESEQSLPKMHVTALHYHADGRLFLCVGSKTNAPNNWSLDLLERNASGSVLCKFPQNEKMEILADNLNYPNGICLTSDGQSLVVSESWSHRLITIRLTGNEAPLSVLDDLPGYPSRISQNDEGYWLAIFAPRGQLMEFVLKEDKFRSRMIEKIDPKHWICPALSSGKDFLEPLQLGSIRVMGQIKPWAPTRSYGLLVRLDEQFRPIASGHSRADGNRHGVTSCLEVENKLLIAVKGDGMILSLSLHEFLEGS